MASYNHIGESSGHLLLNGHSHSASDTPSPTSANRSRADPGTPNPTPSSRDPINGVITANHHLLAASVDFQVIAEKLHNLATEDYNNLSPNRSPRTLSESHSSPRTTSESQSEVPIQEPPFNRPEGSSGGLQDDIVVMKDEFNIQYERYQSEQQMSDIIRLISKDLSEPYSIYTYRYFIHNWPNLCFLAKDESDQYIGAIVCKLDMHKRTLRSRGYIAMLAVHESHRRKKIASKLVGIAIDAMVKLACDEVVLEAECTNIAALRLYEQLGFIRDKRLHKYYLNGVDAFRLKLWIT